MFTPGDERFLHGLNLLKPTEEQGRRMDANRADFIHLTERFLNRTPKGSRERSLALTHLETALMYATKAVLMEDQ